MHLQYESEFKVSVGKGNEIMVQQIQNCSESWLDPEGKREPITMVRASPEAYKMEMERKRNIFIIILSQNHYNPVNKYIQT